jgi:hypothetical protein
MEMLQNGYLHAVAAAAGCALAKPTPDVDGIDWIATHASKEHTVDPVADVWLQLKATAQWAPTDLTGKPGFSFVLKNKHLTKLNMSPATKVRLLVVMIVPPDVADWVEATEDYFALRHACYWANLEGTAPTGQTQTTVSVPTQNVFDDRGLCDIMSKIGAGVTPK